MNRFSRSAGGLDDAALDRAMSRADVPEVPSGLADRIVSAVTRLPQDAAPGCDAPVASPPREPTRRRCALAASFAAAVVFGGAAFALWFGSSPKPSGAPGAAPAVVAARPAAVDSSAPVAVAAREEGQPVPSVGAAKRSSERAPAASARIERAEPASAPPATPEPLPEPAADPVNETPVELASEAQQAAPAGHDLSAPDNPVGPSLANGAGTTPSAANGPVYGPPAPPVMGIAGGSSSPAPAAYPTAGPTSPPRAGSPGRRNRR